MRVFESERGWLTARDDWAEVYASFSQQWGPSAFPFVLCLVLLARSQSVGAYIVGGFVGAVLGFCGTWVVAGLVYKLEWIQLYHEFPKVDSVTRVASGEYDKAEKEDNNEKTTREDM